MEFYLGSHAQGSSEIVLSVILAFLAMSALLEPSVEYMDFRMNTLELRRSGLETFATPPALFPKPNTLSRTREKPCRLSGTPLGSTVCKL